MLLALALASSLWVSAQEAGARAPSSAVIVPVEKIADGLAVDLAFNAFGTGFDLISTDWAVNHGCVEGNPLAPRVEGRVALKIGVSALRGSIAYWARRHGHKKFADIFRWSGFATDLLITGNNVACGIRGSK